MKKTVTLTKLFLVLILLSSCQFFSQQNTTDNSPTESDTTEISNDVTETPPVSNDNATVVELSGEAVLVEPISATESIPMLGQIIERTYTVITKETGKMKLAFSNGSFIRLASNSSLSIEDAFMSDSNLDFLAKFKMAFGDVFFVLNGGRMEIETASGVASVSGSFLFVSVDPVTNITTITCLEGTCTLSNAAGGVILIAGQTAEITSSTSIPIRGTMTEEDFQNWLDSVPEALAIIPAVTQTIQAYANGTPTHTPTVSNSQCVVGTWTVDSQTLQNYLIAKSLSDIKISQTSGIITFTESGSTANSLTGTFIGSGSSTAKRTILNFTITGNGSGDFSITNDKISFVPKSLNINATWGNQAQNLDAVAQENGLNFSTPTVNNTYSFNYSCSSNFLGITVDGVAVILNRVSP